MLRRARGSTTDSKASATVSVSGDLERANDIEVGADSTGPDTVGTTGVAIDSDALENAVLFPENGAAPLAALAVLMAQGLVLPADISAALASGQVISGTDGDDVLFGGAGDILLGGAGDDTLIALSAYLGGADGGLGFDQLIYETDIGISENFAGRSIESVVGSEFDDGLSFEGEEFDATLDGRGGDDELIGGLGNDTLSGGDGSDTLYGLAGDDTFYFDTSDSMVDGGDGIDTAIFVDVGGATFDMAASRIEIAFGGAGDDTFTAAGYDTITKVFGGDGADTFYGGLANDGVNGGAGNDILAGYGGNDTLVGGSGFDIAMFEGERDRYDIVEKADGVVIVSDTLGFEGVDTLSGIEQLHFADVDLIL